MKGKAAGGSPHDLYPASAVAWRTVAILLILYCAAMLDRQVLILMADPIRRSLHVGDFEIGLLHGFAFVLFYATCSLPLGWAADRYPRKPLIFAGVIIWSLSCAASGLAQSTGELFAARMGVGFGEAALLPAAFSLIAQSFPKQQLTTAMAVFASGGILGGGMTTAIGGIVADYAATGRPVTLPVVGTLAAWQMAFILIAAPGLPIAFLAFLIREPQRSRDDRTGAADDGQRVLGYVWARRGFYLRHFFAFSIVIMLGYALLGWTPIAMARDFGWPMRRTGPWLGAVLVATGLVSLVVSGRLIDRLVGRGVADAHMRYYAVASIVLTLAGGAMALAGSAGAMIAVYTILCMIVPCVGIANAALQAATQRHFRGRVSALFLLVSGIIGTGLGTAIIGAATDYVFKDPSRVRDSMALVALVFGPVAAWLFWGARQPFVRAMGEVRGHDLRVGHDIRSRDAEPGRPAHAIAR